MVTGRTLIEDAVREPMVARGWTPRAAGWFTRSVGQGQLGVTAIGVASKHQAPGTATATAYIHFRDNELEAEVARICGRPRPAYQTTTATTPIGYLMPDARWHEWFVEPGGVIAVGVEVAVAIQTYGEPHLSKLAKDSRPLLDSIRSSPAYTTALGMARAALLLRRMGDMAGARELASHRATIASARTDPAAAEERRVADLLQDALAR